MTILGRMRAFMEYFTIHILYFEISKQKYKNKYKPCTYSNYTTEYTHTKPDQAMTNDRSLNAHKLYVYVCRDMAMGYENANKLTC